MVVLFKQPQRYCNKTESWENLHETLTNRRQTVTPVIAKKIDRMWEASMKNSSLASWTDAENYSTRDFCSWLERQFCGGKK